MHYENVKSCQTNGDSLSFQKDVRTVIEFFFPSTNTTTPPPQHHFLCWRTSVHPTNVLSVDVEVQVHLLNVTVCYFLFNMAMAIGSVRYRKWKSDTSSLWWWSWSTDRKFIYFSIILSIIYNWHTDRTNPAPSLLAPVNKHHRNHHHPDTIMIIDAKRLSA